MSSADCTVLVRASGERTKNLSSSILRASGLEVTELNSEGRPFQSLFDESLTYAKDASASWTLMVDADIIPDLSAIDVVVKSLGDLPPETLCVQPRVFDKAFCHSRYAGVHFYNNLLLRRCSAVVPEPRSRRPETSFLKGARHNLGLKTLFSGVMFGLHDFEQDNIHLFKKSFLKGQKMTQWGRYLLPLWTRMATMDGDYDVMKAGFVRGAMDRLNPLSEKNRAEISYWPTVVPRSVLRSLGAKRPLNDFSVTAPDLLSAFHIPPGVEKFATARHPRDVSLRDAIRVVLRREVEL